MMFMFRWMPHRIVSANSENRQPALLTPTYGMTKMKKTQSMLSVLSKKKYSDQNVELEMVRRIFM